MAASDYHCARMGCEAEAARVRVMRNTGALYGECPDHLAPLGDGERWLHEPEIAHSESAAAYVEHEVIPWLRSVAEETHLSDSPGAWSDALTWAANKLSLDLAALRRDAARLA